MMVKKQLFEINAQGELVDPSLLDDITEKYTPDSLFLRNWAPYLIMAICFAIDGCFFYGLFSMISYDRPLLLWVQIAGFLFGFDFVPIYAGTLYKKLQKGLSDDKLMLRLALGVCALICAANIGLRAVTVNIMAPDTSQSDSYFADQQAEETAAAETSPDAVAWMVAITGMIVPVVTSVGSFVISNTCYEPLLIKKHREERMIVRKADKIRRLNTMIQAYEADQDMEQRLLNEDEKQYAAARAMTAGLLLEYHDYIRQQLMAKQQDPASISMLSVPAESDALLDALEQLCVKTNMSSPDQSVGV